MSVVIGIDVGGSTTKVVGIRNKQICNPLFVRATDPVASLFGALGKYLYDNNIPLSKVEKIILTGVGSAYISQPLYGLPTARVDEFLANGLGAQYMTNLDKLIVVSMGTGTSFVKVDGNDDAIRFVGAVCFKQFGETCDAFACRGYVRQHKGDDVFFSDSARNFRGISCFVRRLQLNERISG